MFDVNEGPTRLHPMIAKKMLVVSHVPTNPRENVMINLEGKVKTLFLLKQGTSKVSVTYSKDHFVIGELA